MTIIERLKHRAKFDTCESPYRLMVDAATELTTLLQRCEKAEAERDEALKALEPFAEEANRFDNDRFNYGDDTLDDSMTEQFHFITLRALRAARDARRKP
jgi:hypothetical protein